MHKVFYIIKFEVGILCLDLDSLLFSLCTTCFGCVGIHCMPQIFERHWMWFTAFHSKYCFIIPFLGSLHVNNGDISAKHFNRMIVKTYTVNVYLYCNIYKIQLNFLRGKKWRWKLYGNLVAYFVYFSVEVYCKFLLSTLIFFLFA